jgi:hypothetical protein
MNFVVWYPNYLVGVEVSRTGNHNGNHTGNQLYSWGKSERPNLVPT